MRHDINELWKVDGDITHIYAEEAVKNLEVANRSNRHKENLRRPMLSKVNNGKPFRIWLDREHTEYKLGWLYGEKTWFDSEQEVKDYRDYVAREKRIREIL